MLRTFKEHAIRPVIGLSKYWDFIIEPERKHKKKLPETYNRKIYVPSAWETIPGLENYRGKAWLRTKIQGKQGMGLRLAFGGVSHTGTVYIDGKQAGTHYDAFTPWDVVVPNLKQGTHELVVEVDNSFHEHSVLHKENDYYTYGGIIRPAELQYIPEVYIDKIFAVPVLKNKKWQLNVKIRIKNWSKKNLKRNVKISINKLNANIDCGITTIKPNDVKELSITLKDLNAKPWSSKKPNLYFINIELLDGKKVVHDLIDRIGFREIKVKGSRLFLNGKSIRLRGYNRHEDHPQFGSAIPIEAMSTDINILKDLNCNFVRTSHYPNDMRFLDLCDEMGIYVWEETHSRSIDLRHPKFREQISNSAKEMIESHWNRPCIIIWGCLNECESKTAFGKKTHA